MVDYSEFVATLVKSGEDILNSLTPEKCHLLHMGIGVTGEAGELIDAIKRYVIYEKPLDRKNVIEELGDLRFYMQGIQNALGIKDEEVIQSNEDKLMTRYHAGKYSNKQANERADKA